MPCSVDVREICLSVGLALVPYSVDVREICLSVGLALNVSSSGALFS